MRVTVIGAGPTGLAVGAGLARQGHQVLAVDRDPGPPPTGRWHRKGVMQFEHAHGFRGQVPMVLQRHWPAAYRTWLEVGGEPRPLPGTPDGMSSRRVTFERALRRAAATTPGLRVRQGHVDGIVVERGRAVGCLVDGAPVDGDLVVDASGRAGRVRLVGADASPVPGTRARPRADDAVSGGCGIAYLNRTYRRHEGTTPGPVNSPVGWFGNLDGYQVLLFPHERRHYSVVVVRPTSNEALLGLRHDAAFDAACRAIPGLAEWTHPDRSAPTSGVMVGGALRNVYRRQRGLPGLVTIGDAVTTTAPIAGRGVAMAFLQVDELLRLLDAGTAPAAVAEPFGAWCEREMLPWVLDHISTDTAAARSWQGHDVDLSRPLPSSHIAASAEVEPRLKPYVGPYLAMTALPATLAEVEPLAREVFRGGWRPPLSEGPTADDLVALAAAVTSPSACR